MSVVVDNLASELATKADLLTTQNALTADLLTTQNALTTDLKDLELKIEQRFSKFDARFVRLEVLMALMLAVLLIPTLKSLLVFMV